MVRKVPAVHMKFDAVETRADGIARILAVLYDIPLHFSCGERARLLVISLPMKVRHADVRMPAVRQEKRRVGGGTSGIELTDYERMILVDSVGNLSKS